MKLHEARDVCINGVCSLGTKALSVLREMVIAQIYGVGWLTDLYYFLQSIIMPVLAWIANSVQAEVLSNERKSGGSTRTVGKEYCRNVVWREVSKYWFVPFAVLLFATIIAICRNGVLQNSLVILIWCFLFSIVSVVILVQTSYVISFQTRKKYAYAQVPAMVGVAIGTVLVASFDHRNVILPLAFLVSVIVELALLWRLSNSNTVEVVCERHIPSKEKYWQLTPISISFGIQALSGCIDAVVLSFGMDGSLSVFAYANRINALVLAVGGGSLSIVAFNEMSCARTSMDGNGLRRTANRWIRSSGGIGILVTLVLSAGIVAMNAYGIQFGKITKADAVEIEFTALILSFQIPFYFIAAIQFRYLIVAHRERCLIVLSLSTISAKMLSVTIALLCCRIDSICVATISTISFVCMCIMGFYLMNYSGKRND